MWLIVWYHIAITYNYVWRRSITIPMIYNINIGNIGVTLFLILSGLVLELTYGQKKLGLREFYPKRIVKIFTVYWVCVAFALVIRGYKNLVYFEKPLLDCAECTFVNVTCTLGGFCSQIGLWGGPFMRTAWFIGLIAVLYLFFPLFSRQIQARPHRFLAVLFLVSLLSRILLKSVEFPFYDPLEWFPLNRVFEFGLGVYLAQWVTEKQLTVANWHPKQVAFLGFLGELSFPLFLLHYELDFLIVLFDRVYMYDIPGQLYYLTWVFSVSYLAYWVSQKLLKITMRPFQARQSTK